MIQLIAQYNRVTAYGNMNCAAVEQIVFQSPFVKIKIYQFRVKHKKTIRTQRTWKIN